MVDGIGRGGTLNTIGVEYRRSTLVATLIEHQRLSIGECGCGWNELGQSFALHVALAYECRLQRPLPGHPLRRP